MDPILISVVVAVIVFRLSPLAYDTARQSVKLAAALITILRRKKAPCQAEPS